MRTGKPVEPLRIYLLNGFRVSLGDRSLDAGHLRLRKARDLLKLLALTPSHRLHGEQLMELLWPDADPNSAFHSLYQTLYALRKALQSLGADPQSCLVYEEGLLSLCPAIPLWIDVEAFDEAAKKSRASQDTALFQSALELYTGELLPEDRFEDWAINRRESLQRTYLDLLLELARLHEARSEYQPAIEAFKRALSVDSLQEEAHAGLMRLYALNGQRAQALRQYQLLQDLLRQEVAAEPSMQLTRLYEDISSNRFPPPEELIQAPVNPTRQAARHNLPAQLTSFIGREKEIAQVKSLLADHRLVTLTGAGGSGKTRLELQVARELLEDYPDGVWLVELAPLADPELVTQTAANALGMHLSTGPQTLSFMLDFLAPKNLLLILDNCEHLLEACARLADALLRACPNLNLLASSREALEIAGEAIFLVPPLPSPDPDELPSLDGLAQYGAVRLFVERAGMASPDFTLTPQNAIAVSQVCQRLDGIPLALELAAARLKVLSVEEIALRLDDRFRLLTGGNRAALPRYQTLRASIDWSYALLSPGERVLLQRLSVFKGGWTLEAAESTCPADSIERFEVLGLLSQLVSKSLVIVDGENTAGTRYRMLETIREYAHEKLAESGEVDVASDRHLGYYADLAERVEMKIRGPDQPLILRRLETELDNIRLALACSLEEIGNSPDESKPDWRIASGLGLATDLLWFWHTRLRGREGLQWLERLLIREVEGCQGRLRSPAEIRRRAKALHVAGVLASTLGMIPKPIKFWDESRILFQMLGPDDQLYAQLLLGLGSLEERLAIFKELGDKFGMSEIMDRLGERAQDNHEYEQARTYYEKSMALKEEISDQEGVAWALFRLGNLAFLQNDFGKCRFFREKSRELFTEIGSIGVLNSVTMYLGWLEWVEGNYERAVSNFVEVLNVGRRQGDVMEANRGLSFLGHVALSQGDPEHAAKRFDENLSFCRRYEDSYPIVFSLYDLGILAWSEGDYKQAEQSFAEALAIAREKGLSVFEADPLFCLGRVAFALGEHSQARMYLKESLEKERWSKGQNFNTFYNIWNTSFSILETWAFLEVSQQQMHRAARLLGATEAWHTKWRYTRIPRERDERQTALAMVKSALGEDAFAAAWAEGIAMTFEQAKDYANSEEGHPESD